MGPRYTIHATRGITQPAIQTIGPVNQMGIGPTLLTLVISKVQNVYIYLTCKIR